MKSLVLNSGSSSQKSALYEISGTLPPHPPTPLWQGKIEWNGDRADIQALNSSGAKVEARVKVASRSDAIKQLLENTGMTIGDIDVVEINEAFAAQIVPCKDELGIPDEKLNPFGGAIALGHPFGMTGARIMTTLLNDLETLEGTYGIESMCVAGGMGMAMLVERLS